MGKPTGFIEFERQDRAYTSVAERVAGYQEMMIPLGEDEIIDQGARCMDCGIPFCHNGCPVNNIIPEWNDLVYSGNWREASRVLHSTNNFPEFTGRICPAPCEAACTLNLTMNPSPSRPSSVPLLTVPGPKDGSIHKFPNALAASGSPLLALAPLD